MIRYAGRKFHLERQIEELLVASGKSRMAELFAGSGFISYTTTLKADVLSDVDERLLNYHRRFRRTEVHRQPSRRLDRSRRQQDPVLLQHDGQQV